MLKHLHAHIQALQRELADIDAYLLAAMQPYALEHGLLQTIPGIDQISAAHILGASKNAARWIKQLKLIGKWPAPKSESATASA